MNDNVREALEFYADRRNYRNGGLFNGSIVHPSIYRDDGEKARAALDAAKAADPVREARERFCEAALAEMDPANRPHNEHDHAGADRYGDVKKRKRDAYAALLAAERAAPGGAT